MKELAIVALEISLALGIYTVVLYAVLSARVGLTSNPKNDRG